MKTIFIKTTVTAGVLLSLAFSVIGQANQGGSLVLEFKNLFNNEPLEFGKEYTNAHGETLTLRTLNYFISNIRLIQKDGTEYVVPQDESYFLVKQSDKASQRITLKNLPKGEFAGIGFMVGVDSVRNTLDVSRRTGALDVAGAAKGMYWQWNSGYIFFKMEGKSKSIPDSLSNNFYYHIGGFGGFQSTTINNIRTKKLIFESSVTTDGKIPVVAVNVDASAMFNHKTPIMLAKNSNVMWGQLSVKISENYISTFTLANTGYVTE